MVVAANPPGGTIMASSRRPAAALALAVAVLLLAPTAAVAQAGTPAAVASPPAQPESGPGGAASAYDGVVARHYGAEPDGTVDPTGFWLFEPAEPNETAAMGPVPLVIFLHGAGPTDPVWYRAWIDHIVRRGAVVLYPDFDELFGIEPTSEDQRLNLSYMLAGIRDGLAELEAGEHVAVDLAKVAAVGHSFGGMLAAKYAAIAAAEGLPAPSAIMPVMPGCECPFAIEVGTIPATTRVIMLTSRQDSDAGERWSKPMWDAMTLVPLEQRDYVLLWSDWHGEPNLVVSHATPATHAEWDPLDALDWYGTWKLFDLLSDCSFFGTDCDAALGNTPEQRFMGTWSDGVPVAEPTVTDEP
jgi:pimeloyl-ACP methyl ester carboxylesterase